MPIVKINRIELAHPKENLEAVFQSRVLKLLQLITQKNFKKMPHYKNIHNRNAPGFLISHTEINKNSTLLGIDTKDATPYLVMETLIEDKYHLQHWKISQDKQSLESTRGNLQIPTMLSPNELFKQLTFIKFSKLLIQIKKA